MKKSINEILKELKVKDTKQVNSNYPIATIPFNKNTFIHLQGWDGEGDKNKKCSKFQLELYGKSTINRLAVSRRDIVGTGFCHTTFTAKEIVGIIEKLLGR